MKIKLMGLYQNTSTKLSNQVRFRSLDFESLLHEGWYTTELPKPKWVKRN